MKMITLGFSSWFCWSGIEAPSQATISSKYASVLAESRTRIVRRILIVFRNEDHFDYGPGGLRELGGGSSKGVHVLYVLFDFH